MTEDGTLIIESNDAELRYTNHNVTITASITDPEETQASQIIQIQYGIDQTWYDES